MPGKLTDFETHGEDIHHDNEEIISCIMDLWQLLPDQDRELLKAVEIDLLEHTGYAKQLHINLSTVKSKVHSV
ncbi:hypothetical protein [Anditalea andensis]|uniref:RNA polymerase sigma factor 70 region 4 type 2 domain-containing protein n=1 Tax=Anditalea andensis TaxID=1048983 RepID=A0A074KVP4_9BACT|nr:hypothetical protein [Anditalea andensis]KEO71638.1 hypothetical protein EL17_23555 [Anditalea andensis]